MPSFRSPVIDRQASAILSLSGVGLRVGSMEATISSTPEGVSASENLITGSSIVIKYHDFDARKALKEPIVFARSLERLLDPMYIKNVRKNILRGLHFVELNEISEKLLEELVEKKKFGRYDVTIYRPTSETESTGVINHISLEESTEDIIAGIKSNSRNPTLISAERITKWTQTEAGGARVDTQAVKLTFKTKTLPKHVFLGYSREKVTPFIPLVRICRLCQSTKHSANQCRAKTPTCQLCSESHSTEECPQKEQINFWKCKNCAGNHSSNNRTECEFLKKQQETLKTKTLAQHKNNPNMKRKPLQDRTPPIPTGTADNSNPWFTYNNNIQNTPTHTPNNEDFPQLMNERVPQKKNQTDTTHVIEKFCQIATDTMKSLQESTALMQTNMMNMIQENRQLIQTILQYMVSPIPSTSSSPLSPWPLHNQLSSLSQQNIPPPPCPWPKSLSLTPAQHTDRDSTPNTSNSSSKRTACLSSDSSRENSPSPNKKKRRDKKQKPESETVDNPIPKPTIV